jgi:hypothetical protein
MLMLDGASVCSQMSQGEKGYAFVLPIGAPKWRTRGAKRIFVESQLGRMRIAL